MTTLRSLPYPKSFPTSQEMMFLKVALASDSEFPLLWNSWKESIDWQHIDFATARLLTYFYPRLAALEIRDEFTERVKGVHKAMWVKNQLFIRGAKEVAEICHREGIPVLMLKGIPLIYEVYGDVGARPLGDADLLVRPQDGKRLTDILISRGWRHAKAWAADKHNPAPSVYRVIKATELENNRGVAVDLHYNIFDADHGMSLADVLLLKDLPSLSYPEQFWSAAMPMELQGTPCLRLSNEDMLIHIIVHGSEGNTHRTFRWVLDAALLIERLKINWDLVLERARTYGHTLDLLIAFSLLSREFHSPIPHSVIEALSSLPVSEKETRRYYTVANIEHSRRVRFLGNVPLLWYAYWKFEPAKPLKLFGFMRFVGKTWGLSRLSDVFGFVLRHLERKLTDRDPEFFGNLKRVSRDSALIVGGRLLSFLASFAVIAVMARVLSPQVVGSYNYVIAALAIISISTLPGMNEAIIRAVGRGREGSIHAMLRKRVLWGLGGSVLALLLGVVMWVLGEKDLSIAFVVAAPFVPFTDTLSNLAVNFWQGKKQFGRSALVGAGYYVGLALVSIPIFLLFKDIVLIVASIMVAQAVMGYLAYRSIGRVDNEVDQGSISLGMHLTLMQICGILANNVDKIVLWTLSGPVALAAYVFAATPVSKAYQLLPISSISLPLLSSSSHTSEVRRKVLRNTALLFLLTVPGTVFVIWIAPVLYDILFPAYPHAVPYFQLLFLGVALSPVAVLRSALVAFRETRSLYILDMGVPMLRIVFMILGTLIFGIYGLIVGILLAHVIGSITTLLLFLSAKHS